MAGSPSPVPESGLTLETTAEERAAADAWLATDGCPEDQFDRRIIRDLTAAMQEIERQRAGWVSMFENELRWHDEAAENLARAESAEASARSARAEALAALEPFALVAAQRDEHYDNPDHYSPTIEDFRRAHAAVTAIRSLKTAPKGDGEETT